MKEITQRDIQIIRRELKVKRNELDKLQLSLPERLIWIQEFFNYYIPNLERRYMSEEEMRGTTLLPDELRVEFYLYFPEHGLNMANCFQKLLKELTDRRRFDINSQIAFRHQD